MSHTKQSALSANPRESAGGGTEKNQNQHSDSTTKCRRPQPPRILALSRLDHVEQRLLAAAAAGDDWTYARFYLAWMALCPVAFGWKAGQ